MIDEMQTRLNGGRLRRLLLIVFGLAVVLVLLAPLTATDQADSLGVPQLVDRSQIRILTTVAMFVVMASGWNLVGGPGIAAVPHAQVNWLCTHR